MQRLAAVCEKRAARLLQKRREVEKGLGAQEETVRHALTPAQLQRSTERMTVSAFSVRVVSAATLRVEAQRPRDRFQERGLSRTVLTDEEGHGRREVELEILVLEERDRERVNAGLDLLLFQREMGEKGAAEDLARRGSLTFARHSWVSSFTSDFPSAPFLR